MIQDDFDQVLNPTTWDPDLLLAITLAASTTALLVMSALLLILIKRRRKLMRLKQNQLEQEEEDSRLRDQYSVSSSGLAEVVACRTTDREFPSLFPTGSWAFFFSSLSFLSLYQWCVLNQVPRGGATLLIFNFFNKFLAVQLEAKQA